MIIHVTSQDIQDGIRFSNDSCPIAIAASRCMSQRVSVGNCFMVTGGEGVFEFPSEVKEFIQRFDRGCGVIPISFEIEFFDF